MKARVLDPSEWDRVKGKGLDGMLPYLGPEDSVVVVEKDDEIVAHIGVLMVPHLEGVWIHPRARGNAGVVRMLLRGAVDAAPGKWLMIQSATDQIRDLIVRLGGAHLPVESFVFRCGGRDA